jgi:hypothetical protein
LDQKSRGFYLYRSYLDYQLQSERGRTMAKKRAKKKPRKTPNRYRPLVGKMQSKGLLDDKYEIRYEPKGVTKMSEVLIDFIEPYVEYAETYEAYQKLVIVAIASWNASLLPKRERKRMVKKMVKSLSLPRSDAQDMKGIIEELMERKEKHFPEHTRVILDYQVTETKHGYHLSVASTLDKS